MAKRRSRKISPAKMESMFQHFCRKQSNRYVAQKCKVSITTVRRYRINEDWDRRLRQIEKKVQKAQDESEIERRKRHIDTAKFMQLKAMEHLREKGITSDKVAVHALVQGVRMEREAVGKAGEIGKIILEVVERGPA